MNAAGSEGTTYCANDDCEIKNYNFTKAIRTMMSIEHTEQRMNVAKSQQRQENICSEIKGAREVSKKKYKWKWHISQETETAEEWKSEKKSLKRKLLPFFQFVF